MRYEPVISVFVDIKMLPTFNFEASLMLGFLWSTFDASRFIFLL